jgi:hypothetical protein
LLSRELLYTALTRQQNRIIVFHQGDLWELRRYGDPVRSELARRLTTLLGTPKPVEVRQQFRDENLIHRTRRGELVRSKAELVIANLLDAMGLDYEYERELLHLMVPGVTRTSPSKTPTQAGQSIWSIWASFSIPSIGSGGQGKCSGTGLRGSYRQKSRGPGVTECC